jgi:hypothetical protein
MQTCPKCSARIADDAARFCCICGSQMPPDSKQTQVKNDNTMKVVAFILLVMLALVVIAAIESGSSEQASTQTFFHNLYRTPTGQACTQDDWTRQFLHGLKAGEQPCKIVGETKTVVPVPVKSGIPVKSDDEKDWEYLCSKLREKKFSDMTPNDLDRLHLCLATGH